MDKTAEQTEQPHLTVDQLAARWHKVRGTLSNWRGAGIGPDYIKIGKTILYPESAVIAFEKKNMVS